MRKRKLKVGGYRGFDALETEFLFGGQQEFFLTSSHRGF